MKYLIRLKMIFCVFTGLVGCADGSHQVVFRLVASEVTSDQLSLIEVRLADLAREFGFQEIQAADGIELRAFAKHGNASAPHGYAQIEGASGLGLYLVIRSSGSEILLTQRRGRDEAMFVGIMRERIQAILKEVVGDNNYSVEMRSWRRSALA